MWTTYNLASVTRMALPHVVFVWQVLQLILYLRASGMQRMSKWWRYQLSLIEVNQLVCWTPSDWNLKMKINDNGISIWWYFHNLTWRPPKKCYYVGNWKFRNSCKKPRQESNKFQIMQNCRTSCSYSLHTHTSYHDMQLSQQGGGVWDFEERNRYILQPNK